MAAEELPKIYIDYAAGNYSPESVSPHTQVTSSKQFDYIAHDSASIELLQLAKDVAASDVSVMISGHSGTGKEMLAQFIHQHSPRAAKPFVAINCAAIPDNMLEAVLFGYEKGAFAGASKASPGKFEQAQGGTLLLDDILELDLSLQAKILRVLQEREVERLGGEKTTALDVRIISTTNADLLKAVKEGDFREDLLYRLNVFPLKLTPLQQRPADILPLTEYFIQEYSSDTEHTLKLTEAAKNKLITHSWNGNVRELGNAIQRALVLCNGKEIKDKNLQLETLEQHSQNEIDQEPSLNTGLRSHEQELIIDALRLGNGNRKTAAEKLGISPRTLRYKLAKMRDDGVQIPAF